MKLRPLWIDYHADAVSRLAEAQPVQRPPIVILDPADVTYQESESSDSTDDCTVVPRSSASTLFQRRRRSALPLDVLKDDSSLSLLDTDPLEDTGDDKSTSTASSVTQTNTRKRKSQSQIAAKRKLRRLATGDADDADMDDSLARGDDDSQTDLQKNKDIELTSPSVSRALLVQRESPTRRDKHGDTPLTPPTVVVPIDPAVMRLLLLQHELRVSRKRVSDRPSNYGTFFFGTTKRARSSFWRTSPLCIFSPNEWIRRACDSFTASAPIDFGFLQLLRLTRKGILEGIDRYGAVPYSDLDVDRINTLCRGTFKRFLSRCPSVHALHNEGVSSEPTSALAVAPPRPAVASIWLEVVKANIALIHQDRKAGHVDSTCMWDDGLSQHWKRKRTVYDCNRQNLESKSTMWDDRKRKQVNEAPASPRAKPRVHKAEAQEEQQDANAFIDFSIVEEQTVSDDARKVDQTAIVSTQCLKEDADPTILSSRRQHGAKRTKTEMSTTPLSSVVDRAKTVLPERQRDTAASVYGLQTPEIRRLPRGMKASHCVRSEAPAMSLVNEKMDTSGAHQSKLPDDRIRKSKRKKRKHKKERKTKRRKNCEKPEGDGPALAIVASRESMKEDKEAETPSNDPLFDVAPRKSAPLSGTLDGDHHLSARNFSMETSLAVPTLNAPKERASSDNAPCVSTSRPVRSMKPIRTDENVPVVTPRAVADLPSLVGTHGPVNPKVFQRSQDQADTAFSSLPPQTALCSEGFIETWGRATTELATGQWTSAARIDLSEISGDRPAVGKAIRLMDTSLLDHLGVDIELAGRTSILVCSSDILEAPSGLREFSAKLLHLVASERYAWIHIMIHTSGEMTASLCTAVAQLQIAVLTQNGGPACCPCFHVVSAQSLSSEIAFLLIDLSHYENSTTASIFDESFVRDSRVEERARFLVSLLPSLSLVGALQCLRLSTLSALTTSPDCGDESGHSLRILLSTEKATMDSLIQNKPIALSEVEQRTLYQLAVALDAPLSSPGN